MKKKSTKEKILDALEEPKKKVIEIDVTQKVCDEMNEMAKELGLDKSSDWKPHKPHKLKALFG